MKDLKKRLSCALIGAIILAMGPAIIAVHQYCTWADIPPENHAAAVRAIKFFLFGLLPIISFSSLIIAGTIFGALRRLDP